MTLKVCVLMVCLLQMWEAVATTSSDPGCLVVQRMFQDNACCDSTGAVEVASECSTLTQMEMRIDNLEGGTASTAPFLPPATTSSLLAGKTIVVVHGAGSNAGYQDWVDELTEMGASVTSPNLGVAIVDGVDVWDTNITLDDVIEQLVEHVESVILDHAETTSVVLVGHSWAGIPMTYAFADDRLQGKVERVVYVGAPIPDVTKGEGYFARSKVVQLTTDARFQAYDYYDTLFLGFGRDGAPSLGGFPSSLFFGKDVSRRLSAEASINAFMPPRGSPLLDGPVAWTATGRMQGNPTQMTDLNTKISVVVPQQDFSLGVTIGGGNAYLAEGPSHGVYLARVIQPPGDHFSLLGPGGSRYLYYAIR